MRALIATLVAGATVAACSSDGDDPASGAPTDAAPEASPAPINEAGVDEASSPDDGGAPTDASPLPVVCTSRPCAKSLVTTSTSSEGAGEGCCALLDDGSVACWGTNRFGQLGRGDDGGVLESSEPARVRGVSDVRQLDHTCALLTSGEIWCWGKGPFLRSTTTTTVERTPVKLELPPATRVAIGLRVGCAVVDAGLHCWGSNTNAQLGRWAVVPPIGFLPPRAIDLPAGAPIRDLVVDSATFLLREDGTTLSWGANPPIARVSPLFPDLNPVPTELESIASLDPVQDHACAVARGAGYCWGARLIYEHPLLDRASPERVVAPEPLAQIATTTPITVMYGGTASIERPRWCAVSGKGNVYCWGNNGSGQAGDGTSDYAFEAVQVVGLPAPAAQVRMMPNSTCALLTSGKVFCWGSNVNGQLGSKKPRGVFPTPQEVVLQ